MRLRLEGTERVIVKTRAHPRVLRKPLLAGYLLLAVFPYALAFLGRPGLPDALSRTAPVLAIVVALLGLILLILWCVRPLWNWSRGYTYLTNRRLITAGGTSAHSPVSLYSVHGINVQARTEGGAGTLRVAAGGRQTAFEDMPGVHTMAYLVQQAIIELPRGLRVDGVKMEVNDSTDGTEHG